MDNAADRKSIRQREKQSRVDARAREDVLREIMSTPPGRAWLWGVLGSCHCFSTTFTGDPLTSAFSEGQRSIGLALLADIIQACPDQYIQAMRESNVRSTTDERRSSPESDGGDRGSVDPGAEADGDSYDPDGWNTSDEPGSEATH